MNVQMLQQPQFYVSRVIILMRVMVIVQSVQLVIAAQKCLKPHNNVLQVTILLLVLPFARYVHLANIVQELINNQLTVLKALILVLDQHHAQTAQKESSVHPLPFHNHINALLDSMHLYRSKFNVQHVLLDFTALILHRTLLNVEQATSVLDLQLHALNAHLATTVLKEIKSLLYAQLENTV